MQRSPPETPEFESQALELLVLALNHPVNDVRRRIAPDTNEGLSYSPECARSGLCVVVLAEMDQRRIVQVDRHLVGHKRAGEWKALKKLDDLLQGPGCHDPMRCP